MRSRPRCAFGDGGEQPHLRARRGHVDIISLDGARGPDLRAWHIEGIGIRGISKQRATA
jgi:hypothetical protein